MLHLVPGENFRDNMSQYHRQQGPYCHRDKMFRDKKFRDQVLQGLIFTGINCHSPGIKCSGIKYYRDELLQGSKVQG
jgi:hypothetical protein